jgi:hypothetical protein
MKRPDPPTEEETPARGGSQTVGVNRSSPATKTKKEIFYIFLFYLFLFFGEKK